MAIKREEADLSGQQRYNTQRKHKPFESKFNKRTIDENENTDPNKLQQHKRSQRPANQHQTLDPRPKEQRRIG